MYHAPFIGILTAAPVPYQTAVTEPLFTVTAPPKQAERSADSTKERARVAALLLDDLLFAAPVFCIDSGNSKVVTDRPLRFLSEAADLVRTGKAASYVATLRESVVAIDIDGDDEDEDEDWSISALEHLTNHAEELGGWSIKRRSGGGAGRWHLIACLRSQAARDAFKATVDTIRDHWGATARQIDWRRTLRPLSAPHRKTSRVDLPESIEGAADALPTWAMNMPRVSRPATLGKVTPAIPRQRRLSAIPNGEFWDRLRTPGADYYLDRSLSELLSTARLIVAGYDNEAAWKVVANPQHRGFARARQRGHRWWVKHAWNPAVQYVDSNRGRTGKSPAARWKSLTGPLLAGVRTLFWDNWTPSTRHSREHILAAIGDRMARQGLACRPLPERDLENDTGKSRNTIRDALEAFTAAGVLIRTRTYDQSMGPKASHEFSLNLLTLDFRAETSEPPCSHTPAPRSRSWFSLATTLALHPRPHTVTQLFHLSGYTPTPHPTRQQLANVETGLQTLRTLRVARSTKNGWELTGQAARELRSMKKRKAATAARIEKERRAFSTVWEATREKLRRRWEKQKARALERRAASDHKRREQWWARHPQGNRRAVVRSFFVNDRMTRLARTTPQSRHQQPVRFPPAAIRP
ncbi:hypothetical protein [Streptomyces natalensis]|uniref:Uncharacterized protein n=1 Tax=Streptomyces natalensis ATCC 27448 TaxID=1240678 RepID=A0A0D7CHK6_9ACTN|nr:hypothetical protein [Streptomyces natalensis]KIZ15724.1 hypothetical protein SNA_24950 [Streptomyces natalensis ATCC 27448]